MRELAVYYCPRCGHYAYYQLAKNAVCPKCEVPMEPLELNYQDFMNLDCEERDELLSQKIIHTHSSLIQRLNIPHLKANNREQIATLFFRLQELEKENQHLNETVNWMHDMIWDLVRRNKALEAQLKKEDKTV